MKTRVTKNIFGLWINLNERKSEDSIMMKIRQKSYMMTFIMGIIINKLIRGEL